MKDASSKSNHNDRDNSLLQPATYDTAVLAERLNYAGPTGGVTVTRQPDRRLPGSDTYGDPSRFEMQRNEAASATTQAVRNVLYVDSQSRHGCTPKETFSNTFAATACAEVITTAGICSLASVRNFNIDVCGTEGFINRCDFRFRQTDTSAESQYIIANDRDTVRAHRTGVMPTSAEAGFFRSKQNHANQAFGREAHRSEHKPLTNRAGYRGVETRSDPAWPGDLSTNEIRLSGRDNRKVRSRKLCTA